MPPVDRDGPAPFADRSRNLGDLLRRMSPGVSRVGGKLGDRAPLDLICRPPLTASDVADVCASFQAAVVDTVIDRCRAGLRLFRESTGQPNAMVVAGGVAANGAIRRALMRFCGEAGLRLVLPPANLCTDNGAMIAWAGIERLSLGLVDDMTFAARPRWPLDANAEAVHHGKA
jgi:N6-L-threonylcarbamoyladenine synthase